MRMKKFTCPYCYEEHTIKECRLKCSFNIAGKKSDCRKGVDKDEEGWVLQKFNKKCYKCKEARKQIFCPILEEEIPRDFVELGTSFSVALLGAKASGKSNYIAVLINEIRKKMPAQFHCTLDICCSEESRRYYENYYAKPLFEDKRVVEMTQEGAIPPLIFPLRFLKQRTQKKKMVTLTFYDTAGENLNSIDSMGGYILNAKGIILLLDPLQVSSIRKKLQGKMTLPKQNTDTVEILNRVIQNIRTVKNITGTINVPIALVFTKMDALEKYDILSADSCLREESEHLRRGAFVLSDFGNTDIEMRGILENWMDEEVIQMLKQFSKYSVFGLSALGEIPKDNKISGDEIHPKRVLDPLLWLLAENKYIKTIRG